MLKDKDLLTTIAGGMLAIGTAIQPIANSIQPGTSLHTQDYVQLIMAVVFAILGWATNKKEVSSSG